MTNIRPRKPHVTVGVADSFDDVLSAMMIRSAVFVGEDGCDLTEEVDGNDAGATHVLSRVNGAPAGAMRIRYFGEFAVLERMAVLKAFRGKRFGCRGVAWETGAFAFNFCRLKGYTRFYGEARDGLVDFWKRFAPEGATFEPIPNASVVSGGLLCHPMEGSAPPLPTRVSSMRSHLILTAPEAILPRLLAEAPQRDGSHAPH